MYPCLVALRSALAAVVLSLFASSSPSVVTLPPADHPSMVLAVEARDDVLAVVAHLQASERRSYALALYVTGYYEGGWRASPAECIVDDAAVAKCVARGVRRRIVAGKVVVEAGKCSTSMANCVDLGLLEKSNDGGHACGVGQVHVDLLPTLLPKSMTCEALRADRRLGFEAALLVFQHLVKTCGTMRGAMNAYATGKCPGKSGAVIPLVAKRCKIIGC